MAVTADEDAHAAANQAATSLLVEHIRRDYAKTAEVRLAPPAALFSAQLFRKYSDRSVSPAELGQIVSNSGL